MTTNLQIHVDTNQRPNPLLESEQRRNRYLNIAIPYLCLYAPTALLVSIGTGSTKTWAILKEIYSHGKRGEWKEGGKEVVHCALVVGSVAGSILYPTVGSLISHGAQLANDAAQMTLYFYHEQYDQAAWKAVSSLHTVIYLGSIVYATPALIALSLLSQAAFEAYKASKDLSRENYLEAIANIGLALIRANQARPHVERAKRNFFGTRINQAQFNLLMNQMEARRQSNPQEPIQLEAEFIRQNYSNNIQGITFARNMSNQVYDNMNFDDCSFEKINLNNVKYNNCSFKNTNLIQSIFETAIFNGCNMEGSLWNHASLKNVKWINCNMTGANFNDAVINNVLFQKCKMFETSFLCSKAANSSMLDSDLTDCLIFKAKEGFNIRGGIAHKITRPVVGLLWNHKQQGSYATLTAERLKKDFNALVLTIEMEPDDINLKALNREVDSCIAAANRNSGMTIAEQILKNGGANVQAIKAKAKETVEAIDALWIPGGNDIHPKYYGEKVTEDYEGDKNDAHRTVTEFAMIQQAKQNKVFTLGICRGAQILNVAQGGTLNQEVDDEDDSHWGETHDLKLGRDDGSNAYAVMKQMMGGTRINGLSMHHQANNKLGKGLKKVLSHEGSTEAIVSEDGLQVGLQFHPEAYEMLQHDGKRWKENKNIFSYVLNRAKQHQETKVSSRAA